MSRSRKAPWRGLIIFPLAAALAALATYFILPPKPPDPSIKPSDQEGGLQPIGIPQAAEYFKSGLIFVDVRDRASFDQARIPKARFYDVPEKFGGLAIVVYGRAQEMDQTLAKAEALQKAGAAPVYVLLEGFQGWLDAGLEVEKGD